MPKWIQEVIDVLPDGDYDSDDILIILNRINRLLKIAWANTDNNSLHEEIGKEVKEV